MIAQQDSHNPNRWWLDFDELAAGGGGGGSLLLDATNGVASIDSVRRNDFLPRRSTARLVAESLRIAGLPRPAVIEGYNVSHRPTLAAIRAGSDGRATLVGRFLERVANVLGGTIVRWEAVPNYGSFDLRLYLTYP